MPATARVAYVVSHTHWDREWYLSFPRFRVMLIKVVRGVLDALENDPEFRHFCLDGQCVVLEDYLEIHPEDEGRIRALVERGALSIGPFYMLPDEFLISAESTVRNLVYGHQVAARFGGAQAAGYMPDSFGHIAQLPQILRRSGIDSFVYTRGNGDEIDELGWEYLWRAPDGSTVVAINQCGGYCNAAALGFEEIWHAHTQRSVDPERAVAKIGELFERMTERSNGDVWLLNNGCDHFPVQQEFGRVMGALREAFPSVEFRHASLAEFIEEVRPVAKREFTGELRSGKLHHILSGVWSARMYLKQANDEAQTLLSGCWEPLAAYARFMHGIEYPTGLIDAAWKLLLKNHPHDSICGCSIDEVHREMMPRFAGTIETAEHSTASLLQALVPTFARQAEDDRDTVLCVFNPLPEARTVCVERLVVLQPFDYGDLALVDEAGSAVPFEIVDCWQVERFWGVDYRQELFAERQLDRFAEYRRTFGDRMLGAGPEGDTFLHLRFLADLPATGHATFRLVEKAEALAAADVVRVDECDLENDLVAVCLHPDGTFDLTDKRSGENYEGLNLLEDTEDIGDEYDYSPAERGRTITAAGAEGTVRVVDGGGLRGTLEVSFVMRLPARIESDRKARCVEEIDCPVCVRISLEAGSPMVDIDLRIDNRAEDHRLRALFPTGRPAETLVSDGAFHLDRRSIEELAGDDWVQPPLGTFPQQDFSVLGDLAVFNRGLPEVAADPEGVLKLTLLRCVGWLSRDDFPTRRCQNAGPTIPTPEAQCLGEQRFRYAVCPGDAVQAKRLSQRWRTPVPVVQGVSDGAIGGGSLVACEAEAVCVTAVKRHQSRDTLVVRLYNLTGKEVEAPLRFGFDAGAVWRVNLLEERAEEVSLPLRVGPFEILTIEVE